MVPPHPGLVRKVFRGVGDARGSPEFATGNDQHLFAQPAILEVVEQRRQRLVHLGQPLALGVVEVERPGVIVPTEVLGRVVGGGGVDIDNRHTRLGQPPGQQATLSPAMPTVPIAPPRILRRQFKRAGDPATGQHLEGRRAELINPLEAALQVQVAPEAVELGREGASIVEAGIVDARREGEVLGGIIGDRGVASFERLVRHPEVGGLRHERCLLQTNILRKAFGMAAPEVAGDHAKVGVFRAGGGGGVGDAGRLAGQYLDAAIVVRGHLVVERADDRKAIGPLGLQGEVFADLHPGDVGRDGDEGPAIFAGSLRFEIVRFKLAGTAPHPEQDDRSGPRGRGARGLSHRPAAEHLFERHPTQREHTSPQEFPPADRSATKQRGHGSLPQTTHDPATVGIHQRLLKCIGTAGGGQ